jgi:class 3 adenylate cyclase/predicted ATPase
MAEILDVSRWLLEQGLGHHAEAFAESGIAGDVLRDLTDADLKELGLNLGDRKRLLKAIAALPATLPAPDQPEAVARSAPRVEARDAERRQLTVMFVDLVGSTTLSARLDPEDMREVIRAYQNAVAGEIARFEGHVAKFMGDGVLAYFGWPRAHEDEVERAVRAGLAITAAVGRLRDPAGEALAARIGLATGLVVVGDLVGEGAAQEQAVVGDTPNLAARLQGVAASGQVVIADATRRLLGSGFELRHLGEHDLKGVSEPVPVFAVTGELPVESRFEAMSGPMLLPMVGRDQELALLLERWTQAKAGEGQGVLLVGEAGIGKSRISRALLDVLAEEPQFRVRYQCSPYHTDSALWPVIQQLSHAAVLEPNEPIEARLDKLEMLLDRAGGREAAPLVADLLGLDGGERYAPLNLTPQAQRVRTLQVLVEQLLGLAARQPVLVVLEDAHWIDPTTLELVEHCLDRIADARVLILLTSRTDHQPALAGHPHVTRLTLNRLSRSGVVAIVARLGGDRLSSDTVDAIIARTDGVPLFVEELTKTVLETNETAVPASLHDSLMARLDRYPEVKEIAQIAACIGREFDYPLLAAVADRPESELRSSLDRLAAAELIFRRGAPPDATYTFKHALVQDAAYHSLLKSKRQQLHAGIAHALEQHLPSAAEAEPEVLAQHLTAAGLAVPAIPYWRRAGELAAGRSANMEAIAHLTKGLELIATLPNAADHLDEELALLMAIGGALMATRGYAAPEVERTYSRASALCEGFGRSAQLFAALRGLWNCYLVRGEYQLAHDLAERLVGLAEEHGTPLHRALARRARGTTLFFLGRFTDATAALEEGIAIDDAVADWEERRADLVVHTERAAVACRLYSAMALWFLGYPDRARERIESSLALAQRLTHLNSLAFAQTWAAIVYNLRREFVVARGQAERAIAISGTHRMSAWFGHANVCRGFALVGLAHHTQGIEQLETGLRAWNVTGARLLDTQWLGCLAEANRLAGQFDDALAALDQAAEIAAATGECHYEAELHRVRGMLVAEVGDAAEAVVWLQRAIETARGQQAKSLELRAATSLARLWRDQGKHAEARDLLAPVYSWFTEGFETADLKDAKALLEELQ